MIPIYNPRIETKSAKEALESGWISSQGPYIEKARSKLSEILNIPYVILTNNGTSSTHMIVKALRFKHPEIKTIYAPNNIFVAVWNTILYEYEASCMKILEMDPLTLNMRTDVEYIETLENGAAVMVVHNVGSIVNVPRLKRLRPDLIFIEDNCEGFFGKYEDMYSGTSKASLCSSVSFFANKTVTCGEGGAFFTHDKEIYDYINSSINHGNSKERYIGSTLGYNYRITNIQAALLYDQLIQLEDIRNDKHIIFETYKTLLKKYVIVPQTEDRTVSSEWMFVCGIKNTNYKELELYMKDNGVDIRPFFYDINRHSHLKHIYRNPIDLVYTYIMLPSYPDLTVQQLHLICNSIINYIMKKSLLESK